MDSGNSGSMSSSGGDEDYNSITDSLPATFLNPSTHFGSLSSSNLYSNHQQPPTFFCPSSPNFFHSFSQSPPNPNHNSSLVNLDLLQSRTLRSNNNIMADCNDLGGNNNLLSSSSSATTSASSSKSILRSLPKNRSSVRSSSPSDQTQLGTRNSKKRTRTSRRAPTTVLTTDTSNFRAMVQEFTGIPAPPFSSSPFSRPLDLFGSGMRSIHLDQMSSLYSSGPAAEKVDQESPLLFCSTSSPPSLNNTITTANMLNMENQNHMLTFQSLLQPPPSVLPLPLLKDLDLGMNNHGQVNINSINGLHTTTRTPPKGMGNDQNQHQDH